MKIKPCDLVGMCVTYRNQLKVVTKVLIRIDKNTCDSYVKLRGVGFYVPLCNIDMLDTKQYIQFDL